MTAYGVTPYATTYWSCACVGVHAGYPLISNQSAIISDYDGDGVVRWNLGTSMMPHGIWTMFDPGTGKITARHNDGSVVAPIAFPKKAFLRNEKGDYVRFARDLTGAYEREGAWLFWARPGKGAWFASVVDNGSHDDDGWGGEVIVGPRIFTPVAGSPPVPSRFERDDVVIVLDQGADHWTGDTLASHLEESAGPGVITFGGNSAEEEDRRARILLFRLEGTDGAASVHAETSDLTAIAGTHYESVSQTVRFQPGQIQSELEVPLIDDHVDSGTRRFRITLTNPSGAAIRPAMAQTEVRIVDNDSPPIVFLDKTNVPETDEPQDVDFKVWLSHSAPRPVKVEWALYWWGNRSSVVQSGLVEFAIGEREKVVTIHCDGDDIYGGNVPLGVTITNLTNAIKYFDGRVWIIEDEPLPILSAPDITVRENDKEAVLTVLLNAPFKRGAWEDYELVGRTATASDDFTAMSGQFLIPGDSLSAVLRIPIRNDEALEGDEAFDVVFPWSDVRATVTILDDEVPDVTVERRTIAEGGGGDRTVPLRVSLSRAPLAPATAKWKTVEESSSALPRQAGSVRFDVGEREKTIELHYVADNLFGGDRKIAIAITEAANARAGRDGRLTIEEDDPPPLVTVEDAEVAEGSGTATVSVRLSAPLSRRALVNFHTESATATAGTDFEQTLGAIELPAGATVLGITVPIREDNLVEGSEAFDVVIAPQIGGAAELRARITIVDNDTSRRRSAHH